MITGLVHELSCLIARLICSLGPSSYHIKVERQCSAPRFTTMLEYSAAAYKTGIQLCWAVSSRAVVRLLIPHSAIHNIPFRQ